MKRSNQQKRNKRFQQYAMPLSLMCAGSLLISQVQAAEEKPADANSHYWQLGIGSYGATSGAEDTWSGMSDLDRARMDWAYVLLGDQNTTGKELNRLLKINPKLKFMVRLWPINGLGATQNNHMATFLDYLYAPGVKEKLLAETSRQIHSILDPINKPENVVGFTFLEELPMHFTGQELRQTDTTKLPWALELYKSQIEKERGKPLVWNAETRKWWGGKFSQVINEINSHIKKESGNKLVFTYIQTNHTVLDYFPDDVDLNVNSLIPIHFKDVIKPGSSDGFFVYPNSPQIFKRYLDLATKNNWLFFSQVAHPGEMRLSGWDEQLRLASTKVPQNMGYFFFCFGLCKSGAWNDDPSIPADDNFRPASIPSHFRRFANQHGVGIDVVNNNLTPQMEMEYSTQAVQAGEFLPFNLLIHNTRNASWHLDEANATLKNVRVTITPPTQFPLAPVESFPASMELGDIGPDQTATIMWWSKAVKAVPIGTSSPVSVVLSADNCPPTTLAWSTPGSIIAPNNSREVRRSGEQWVYSAYHIKKDEQLPTIVTLQCLRDTASNPALVISNGKFIWQGTLTEGQTLIVGPGRKAFLKETADAAPRDVSDRLGGNGVSPSGYRLNTVTYTDDDVPSSSGKLKITIAPQIETVN